MVSLTKCVRVLCTVVTKNLLKNHLRTLYRFNHYSACCAVLDRSWVNCRSKLAQTSPITGIGCHSLTEGSIENILINECLFSEDEATSLATSIRSQCSSQANILKNYEFLKDKGISNDSIRIFPWVLGYNSVNLPSALDSVGIFDEDLNVVLPLLSIPFAKLNNVIQRASEGSEYFTKGGKIKWLSQLLQCDEQLLCQKLARHIYVLQMSPERILSVVGILIDGGVNPSSLVYDINVFMCHPDTLLKRTEILKNANITNVRPWCLRTAEKTFQRMVERQIEIQKLLGDYKSNKEYLAAKLDCETNMVLKISLKIPQVKHISPPKIKKILDYLFEEGYTTEEICSMPRILTRSVTTIKSRVEELRKLNCTRITLFILCKTKKEYSQFVNKCKNR